jgi:hypothetical protein
VRRAPRRIAQLHEFLAMKLFGMAGRQPPAQHITQLHALTRVTKWQDFVERLLAAPLDKT